MRGLKDYKCDSCDKSFQKQELLRNTSTQFMRGLKDYKEYKRYSCGKSFTRLQTLEGYLDI